MQDQHHSPSDKTVARSRDTATASRIREGAKPASMIIWLLLVISLTTLNFLGIPARLAELTAPCDGVDTCTNPDQLLPHGREAIEESLGITPYQYMVGLEVVANIFVLGALIPGILIFWQKRDNWMSFVATLFMLMVAITATRNASAFMRMYNVQFLAPVMGAIANTFVVLMFYMFPSGRFVPKWTRWGVLLYALYQFARAIFFNHLIEDAGNSGIARIPDILIYGGGAIAQIYRYRKVSDPVERQQTKWVINAIGVHVVVFVILIIATVVLTVENGYSPELETFGRGILFTLYAFSFLLIPTALMFAIFRYRLWDIDFIINKSMVYTGITLSLGLLFTGVAFLIHSMISRFLDEGSAGIALAIAMISVGMSYQSVRRLVQRFVDKQVYGIELDYERVEREYAQQIAGLLKSAGDITSLAGIGKLDLIGKGGMAEVYRANHPRMDVPVAIKILPNSDEGDNATRQRRFEREAKIVASLDHPNIVKLYDYGHTDDEIYFIIMEYIQGSDLMDIFVERGRLTLAELKPILQQIVTALDYAHEKGVVHRDIKPSNIMVESTQKGERAVLMDFGIAQINTDAMKITATGLVGTFNYIAPEQIRESKTIDGRADIYSLGVVCFQLLTGRLPFEKRSSGAMLLAHMMQPPPSASEVSDEIPAQVSSAIIRAMSKKPSARFASAQDMFSNMIG